MKLIATIMIAVTVLAASSTAFAVGDGMTKAQPLASGLNLVPEAKLGKLAKDLVADYFAYSKTQTNVQAAATLHVDDKDVPINPDLIIEKLISNQAAATMQFCGATLKQKADFYIVANGRPDSATIGWDDSHGYNEPIVLMVNKNAPELSSFVKYAKSDRAQLLVEKHGFRPIKHSDR